MSFDTHANLISVTVTITPSPAISGTTLSISNADRTALINAGLTVPFNVTVGPATGRNEVNQEILRITNIGAVDSGGPGFTQLVIARLSESGGVNRSITVGDTMKVTLTKKTITDIEGQINTNTANIATLQAQIGSAGNAWTTSSDTWVYFSANQVKITGVNRTGIFKKGTRVQFTNNALTFYGVLSADSVLSGSDTLLTFAANNDFSVNNSAITNPSYSYYPAPPGYPTWFNYTPTYNAGGSMTFTGVSTTLAKFKIDGSSCTVVLHASGTTGGVASGTIGATGPVTSDNVGGDYRGGASVYDGGNPLAGFYEVDTSTVINFSRYDGANFGLGSRQIAGTIVYGF